MEQVNLHGTLILRMSRPVEVCQMMPNLPNSSTCSTENCGYEANVYILLVNMAMILFQEHTNTTLSRTHQSRCEPLTLRSLTVVICNWTVPLSNERLGSWRFRCVVPTVDGCDCHLCIPWFFLRRCIYPPVNEHGNGKSSSLIGDTSSNGCFSIVILVFGGCISQVVQKFKLNTSTLRRGRASKSSLRSFVKNQHEERNYSTMIEIRKPKQIIWNADVSLMPHGQEVSKCNLWL